MNDVRFAESDDTPIVKKKQRRGVLGARLILEYAGNSAGTEADEIGFNLKKSSTGETSFNFRAVYL